MLLALGQRQAGQARGEDVADVGGARARGEQVLDDLVQLRDRERLLDEVVGAEIERGDHPLLLSEAGDDDADRGGGGGAHGLEHGHAVLCAA